VKRVDAVAEVPTDERGDVDRHRGAGAWPAPPSRWRRACSPQRRVCCPRQVHEECRPPLETRGKPCTGRSAPGVYHQESAHRSQPAVGSAQEKGAGTEGGIGTRGLECGPARRCESQLRGVGAGHAGSTRSGRRSGGMGAAPIQL
jgi:hypothetical protein